MVPASLLLSSSSSFTTAESPRDGSTTWLAGEEHGDGRAGDGRAGDGRAGDGRAEESRADGAHAHGGVGQDAGTGALDVQSFLSFPVMPKSMPALDLRSSFSSLPSPRSTIAGERMPLLMHYGMESAGLDGGLAGADADDHGDDDDDDDDDARLQWWLSIPDRILASTGFRWAIIMGTIYVIFVDNIEVLAELPDPRDANLPFFLLLLKLVVFVMFVVEMAVTAIVRGREYLTSFFFILDAVTLLSFAPDFAALFGVDLLSSASFKLAKAGREARVSARAARLLTLVRIEKIVKQQPHPVDALDEAVPGAGDEAVGMNTSFFALPTKQAATSPSKPGPPSFRFGEVIIQSTTNKVTALVLLLFIAATLLQWPLEWQPHAQAGLNAVEGAWQLDPQHALQSVIPLYLQPYSSSVRAVQLVVNNTVVLGGDFDMRLVRNTFIETVTTDTSVARFNVSHTLRIQAALNVVLMLFVLVILAVGNAVICWDAYHLVELGDKLIKTMELLTDHVTGAAAFAPALVRGGAPGALLAPQPGAGGVGGGSGRLGLTALYSSLDARPPRQRARSAPRTS